MRRALAAAFLLGAGCRPPADGGTGGGEPGGTGASGAADSDGDGVSDAEERAAGTDPDDPTSAPAWHPELTERPRLLLGPDELPRLAEALAAGAAGEEPWATLRGRLEEACGGTPAAESESLSHAQDWANRALACAALAAGGVAEVDGADGPVATGDRAADLLGALPERCEDPHAWAYKADLYAGHALVQGVRAWDLLVGAGYPEGRDPEAAAAALAALGAWAWDFYVEAWPEYLLASRNNHNLKLAAAFGILGMGLNEDPRAARYVAFAASEIPRLHGELLAEDGGWAEGPAYLVYTMVSELPWLAALDRWLGDGTVAAWRFCAHDLDPDCAEGPLEADSPLRQDPRICAAFDRFAEGLMPVGTAPNTDDANLAEAPLGLSAALCSSGLQAWGWRRQRSAWVSGGGVDLSADTLLRHDPTLAAEPPEPAPLVRRAAGTVVLRAPAAGSDLDPAEDPAAAWAMLLAETGAMVSGGRLHEHPDALAVLWAVGGDDPSDPPELLLDGGYGSWEEHEEVAKARTHNVVLVDAMDEGARAPRVLDAREIAPGVQGARAEAALGEDARWERAVVLVEDRLLVVLDRVRARTAHDFTLAWHAPSTAFSPGKTSTWDLARGPLRLATLCDRPTTVSTRESEHSFWGTLEPHAARYERAHAASVTWITAAAAPGSGETIRRDGRALAWSDGRVTLDGAVEVGETRWEAWGAGGAHPPGRRR